MVGVGRIRASIRDRAPAIRRVVRRQGRARHPGRCLQVVHPDDSFGYLRLAVQRLGPDRQLDRLAGGLPLRRVQACLQRGVTQANQPVDRAGFTGAVGDLRLHAELEHRFVLRRHGGIGLSHERHGKRTVRGSLSLALTNLLPFFAGQDGAPDPVPPDRPAHLTHHAVPDLGAIDGGAGIGLGLAGDADLLAKARGLCRRIERNKKPRALVFLDLDPGLARGRPKHTQTAAAGHAAARSRELAVKRSERVGGQFGTIQLAPVRVLEQHRQRPARQHPIIVARLVHPQTDPLIKDGLTRPIQRAVGEQDGAFTGPSFAPLAHPTLRFGNEFVQDRTQPVPRLHEPRLQRSRGPRLGRHREEPVGVRADGW